MRRRFVAVALVVVLLSSLPVAVAAQAGPALDSSADRPATASIATVPDAPSIRSAPTDGAVQDAPLERTVTLHHRPETPGEFGVELTMAVPERVSALTITLESGAAVESASGFERAEPGVYEWTGETDRPSITYAMSDDWHDRDHRSGTQDDDERFFADAGEWGIVPVPRVGLDWRRPSASAPVSVERRVVVDGPGATGGDVAYFGAVAAEYERDVRGETIRLVVPEAADLRESPADVLDALAHASDALRIDGRNDEVFVVAAPTDGVEWGARGIQFGDADAWVAADARLETASSPWRHEYVHARQAYAADAALEARWLVEAQAEYHAALLALEAGRIDYRTFESDLAEGRESPARTDVLAEPSTWRDPRADYDKGALVLGALDRRIRLETGGNRTLEHVVRRLNLREDRVTGVAFLDVVEETAGEDVREFAARHVSTEAAPETWDRAAHREAFDREIAVFEYGLGDDAAVTGPYRDASLADAGAVVVGETVDLPVRIENVGERAGDYYAPIVVDGRVVAAENGTLAAGGTGLETVAWTPTEAGRYDVRVGDDRDERLTVRVRDPADASITDLTVDDDRVDPDDPVTVRVTATNDAERPADRTVSIRTPDGVAHETRVRLAPGESTTVDATVSFGDPGRYEIAVGDRTATVTVTDEAGPRTEAPLEEVPGFGAAAAVAALAGAIALAAGAGRLRRSD